MSALKYLDKKDGISFKAPVDPAFLKALTEPKKEPKKEPETFLGLKIGHRFSTICDKIRYATDAIAHHIDKGIQIDDRKINIDERTKRAFFGFNDNDHHFTFVSKVNKDYAMVVGVDIRGTRSSISNEEAVLAMEYNCVVNSYVLGKDDYGKVFIHYLQQVNSDVSVVHRHVGVNIDHYFDLYTQEFIDSFLRWHRNEGVSAKRESMENVVEWMNRADEGYTRLQGDIVYRMVEVKKGICQTHKVPLPAAQKVIKSLLLPYSQKRDVWKIRPSASRSSTFYMCRKCIESLGEKLESKSKYDEEMGMEVDYSLQFGNHNFKPEKELFTLNSRAVTFNSELDLSDISKRMWAAEPGQILGFSSRPGTLDFGREGLQIVMFGPQNVILEHKEHEDKSLYIPEGHMAQFQFQRTFEPVMGAE